MKKTYTMNGNTYANLTTIAKELGLSRIRPSQFSKYGITENTQGADAVPAMALATQDTTVIDTQDATPAPALAQDNTQVTNQDTTTNQADIPADPQPKDEPDQKDEPTLDDKKGDKKSSGKGGEPKADKQPKDKTPKTDKAPKEPTLADTIQADKAISEDISKTVSLEDFSKALRKVPLDVLEACATKAGVELPSYDSAPIQRMHLTLNLREHFYPGQKVEPKKASLFRKVSLDVLVSKADELGLSYRVNDATPDAIVRMWVTKALMDAGVKAEDLMPQPAPDTGNQADASDKGATDEG